MSATWDCQKHANYNLMGGCIYCEAEEKIHWECTQKIEKLEADNAKLLKETAILKEQLAVFTEMYQRSAILRNKYRSALERIANENDDCGVGP